ncbi:MAG TPA: hypothetical protein VLA77_01045 [Candidatus Saccharimonadales bacterium]|nr:hypothetical protein [Candidatus Saccharimonadales bacterium]
MDTAFLEQYYEKVILPLYKDDAIKVAVWKDHGQVGPDSWAHYFEDTNGTEYVLLAEDYPNGSYLNDDLSHDVVLVPDGESAAVKVTIDNKWFPNISGYFTLLRERSRT